MPELLEAPVREPLNLPNVLHREEALAEFTRIKSEREEDSDLYEMSFSSELPVERWFGQEVLEHSEDAVRLGRLKGGGAVLVDHRGDQVGVVEEAWIDKSDRKLRGKIRFSKSVRGQEIEADVRDRIRRWVSIGYWVYKALLVETGESAADDKYRVVDWEPLEVSIVAVPADPTVGPGRSLTECPYRSVVVVRDGLTVRGRGGELMEPKEGEKGGATATVTVDPMERINALAALAAGFNAHDRLSRWISEGKGEKDAMRELLEGRATAGTPQGSREVVVELNKREREQYSICRALEGGLSLRQGNSDLFKGLEREVHDEIERKHPFPSGKREGAVYIPLRTQTERALNTIQAGKGSELVFEQQGDLIELLRPVSLFLGGGATVLTGLGAPVYFPKQTGGMTFYWVGENPGSGVSKSDLALGNAQLTPKSFMGRGSWSRQIIAIGNRDAENMVRDEFRIGMALGLDKAALHGKGNAGEPHGIYNSADVNSFAMGGVPTFGKLIDMETEVAKDNADLGNLRWFTTPPMAGKMMQTLVASAAGSDMIWRGTFRNGIMAGYPADASNLASATMNGSDETGGTSHALAFGNVRDMVIGFWAAAEVIVDPYTEADKAMIVATAFLMADVMLRHGESFCKATGATIA